MQKKWLSVLSVIVLVLLALNPVFAGGQKDEAVEEETVKSLSVWHAYAGQADKVEFMNYAMNSFKEKYPDIVVEEVPMEHSAYKLKLNTAMATGNPPDVFYTLPGGYLGAFVDGDQVFPLDDALKQDGWGDSIVASALDRVKYDGITYGVPIDIDATVIWYNKTLFAEYGWDIPKTFQDLLVLIEVIKKEGIIPLSLGNKDRWPATFWFQYPMMRLVDSGVVDAFNAGDPNASFSPEGAKAFQVVQDLVKVDAFPKGFNGMTAGEANMLFLNSKAAMVLNGTWQIGMSADAPDDFELGFFPFVTFKDGKADQSDVIAGVAACFAMSRNTVNKDAAILFLKHMTSPEIAAKYVEIRKTLVTTKGATTAAIAGEVLYSISKDVIEKSASLDSFYDTAMIPTASETYYSTLQAVLSLEMSPEEAAKLLDASMRASE